MVPADSSNFSAPHDGFDGSGAASVDSPAAVRQAGRDLLSLALIDSRNLTLQALGLIERAQAALPGARGGIDPASGPTSPLWIAGHIGWFGEYWIGRNMQRALGRHCPAEPTRIASIEPDADRFWDLAQQGTSRPAAASCIARRSGHPRLSARDAGRHARVA